MNFKKYEFIIIVFILRYVASKMGQNRSKLLPDTITITIF